MNGQAIQEKFEDVYRTFYGKCEIVCSAPSCFFWSGDSLVLYGIPALVQKLPLRVRVGLESSRDQGVSWGTFQMYDPGKELFVDCDCSQPTLQRVVKWLNSTMGEIGLSDGIKIHVLSEVLFGPGVPHAAQAAGAIMTSLAAGLMIKGPEFTAEQVADCCRDGQGALFDRLFRLAWKLTLETTSGYSLWNGADVFCATVPSLYPHFYISEPRLIASGDHVHRTAALYPASYDDVESAQYVGFRLADFTASAPPWHWPFDFGLLYTGLPKRTHDAVQSYLSLPLAKDDFAKWLQRKLAPHLRVGKQSVLPSHRRPAQLGAKIWQKQVEPAAIISSHMLFTLVNIFEQGFSEDRMQSFVADMNSYHCQLQSLGLCDAELDDIRHRLMQAVPQGFRDMVGAKLSGAGKGGGIVFASPSGALHDLLEPLVKRLRSEGWSGARVEYASWLDGYEERGLVVEQCVREHLLSASLGLGYARVILWNGIGRPEAKLVRESDVFRLIESYDVAALVEERAIYVAGERMKTRDGMHSAAYTAKLLTALLSDPALKLSSEQMPEGYCYSSESFELQSKIVSPLRRIIRDKTGKDLNLKVVTVAKRVQTKLVPSGVKICVVDRRSS